MADEFMHDLKHGDITSKTEAAYTFAVHGPDGSVGFELTISGENLVRLKNFAHR